MVLCSAHPVRAACDCSVMVIQRLVACVGVMAQLCSCEAVHGAAQRWCTDSRCSRVAGDAAMMLCVMKQQLCSVVYMQHSCLAVIQRCSSTNASELQL